MNKTKKIFSVLVILIIDILALVAQPTPVPGENCDKPQTCNDNAGFNYVFCKPGSPDSLIIHCSKNPNNQRDWDTGQVLKPVKRTMPVCAKLARVEGDTTFDFTMAELQSKMDQASGGWNCLCDFPNNSNNCCARIIFTEDRRLTRGVLAETKGLLPQTVPQPCDQFSCDTESVKIYILNDRETKRKIKYYLGDSTNFVDPMGQQASVSLTHLLQHEIGHYANMNHYYTGGYNTVDGVVRIDKRADCGNRFQVGVMHSTIETNVTRKKLSNYDKCHFMLLYCPEKIGTSSVRGEGAVINRVGNLYPNPAKNIFRIPISLSKKSNVKVTLYGSLGNKIMMLQEAENVSEGNYSLEYNANHLASGEYFCAIEIDGTKETRKFVVQR